MSILFRIKWVLAHPSYIARLFKDKFYIPLLFLFTFLALTFGAFAAIIYNGDFIQRDDAVRITNKLALNVLGNSNFSYHDYKLEGDKVALNYNDQFKIYFNAPDTKENLNFDAYGIFFQENEIKGYVGKSLYFTKSYTELSHDFSFNLEDIKNSDSKNRTNFIDFLTINLENFEPSYKNQKMLGAIAITLEFYFIMMLIMFVFTYLLNPTIKFDVRLKLMIYDSIIFFIIFVFSIIFNVEFIQYVAAFLALIYSNITFRHIIKKDKLKM